MEEKTWRFSVAMRDYERGVRRLERLALLCRLARAKNLRYGTRGQMPHSAVFWVVGHRAQLQQFRYFLPASHPRKLDS